MVATLKGWWFLFTESLSKYLMHYLITLGLALYFIGQILAHYNFNTTITELFLALGKIILGTGFFTGLTKSRYYANFFQDKIFNILYHPGNHFSDFEIKSKWLLLTNYMLSKKVKKHHSTASQVIFDRFLNPEHGYYYRNMTIDYDVSLGADGKTLEITQVMCMEIVFNDDETEALLEQKIYTDGKMELVQLIIDDKKEDHQKHYTPCTIDPKTMLFSKTITNQDGSPVKVERTYHLKQNIHDEPYIISNYSKFIKGISVRYKANNCKVTFRQTGIINTPSNDVNVFDEENGYTRVVLASKDDLTLPGQGFILILSK
ncbi:hypothetical protein L8P10_01465 [Enterobacter kobei]|uniref:hypothetical protein n=1 Tax=Enterobacter kobei TaxID=208224 RepID=UPI0020067E7A|nr:hypothetical protein [Enterobacter kobei]MCK7190834.1 hypothetical protein [Enterobacter kobei]